MRSSQSETNKEDEKWQAQSLTRPNLVTYEMKALMKFVSVACFIQLVYQVPASHRSYYICLLLLTMQNIQINFKSSYSTPTTMFYSGTFA